MTNLNYFLQSTWNKTLDLILESKQIPEEIIDMYFLDTKLYDLNDSSAVIVVPGFINYTILNQNKEIIEAFLSEVINNKVEISIIEESKLKKNDSIDPVDPLNFFPRKVDPGFTFDNFVIGRSNLQAQVASYTVANNPGYAYNPLFIYGGSGIGKTHLLNAIGNYVKSRFPAFKIGFISASDFVDDVFKAKKENAYDELKDTFRQLDLLLVDDIQFLASKPKSHELFFTIFNELVNNKKQIVVTSDQSPDDIKGLEDRLITRFNQGLTVNIVAPEYETALNIVNMKIRNNRNNPLQVDDDVISYIATNFSQNVRSLEGAINRLLFYSISFSDDTEHITLKVAIEAFKDEITNNRSELTIAKIRKEVCDYYSLSKQQIIGSVRTKNIANARHIAIYLCRKLLDAPYEKIGEEFGKRDHSTIMNSCKKVEEFIKKEPVYLKAIQEIENRLK